MDKGNDSDTHRSEDGHIKNYSNSKGTQDLGGKQIPSHSNTSKKSTTPTYTTSQTLIEASISNARHLLSDIQPVDTNDLERIKTLENALSQYKAILDQLTRHVAETRAEMELLREQHEEQRQQWALAHREHQQVMEEQTELRNQYKADLEESKSAMEMIEHAWQSHEQQIQKAEEERIDLEKKKELLEQEAQEKRNQLVESLTKAAEKMFVPKPARTERRSQSPVPSTPLQHASPASPISPTNGAQSTMVTTSTTPSHLESVEQDNLTNGTNTSSTTLVEADTSLEPVTKLEQLEAKRMSLLAEYAENLQLLKSCRELIDDLHHNLGPEALASLQDKIHEREAKITELEERLQSYQVSEMVEEKTADALLMKMQQVFERRLAHADEEFTVVLEAAVAKEKALEKKAEEAMKRYVEKHQESILAEERGSQVEFELMHQRNRIRELELQLQHLQGLGSLS
ncbi:hypothetical protein BGW42_003528 [Actinomortierella wolfii]|nr:hypothetical protein BGW42_003528 [Actinomortierella wolfii]